MMDPVHPDDTLFLVAEADFRFYKADAMGEQANLDMEQAEQRAQRYEAQERASNVPPATDVQRLPGSDSADAQPMPGSDSDEQAAKDEIQWQDFVREEEGVRSQYQAPAQTLPVFEPRLRPSHKEGRERAECTPELEDIVCLCNAAARLQRGNLVWLGWNAQPGPERKCPDPCKIANGSQLVAITAAGARWLQPVLEAPLYCVQMFKRSCILRACAARVLCMLSSRPCPASLLASASTFYASVYAAHERLAH